MVNGAFEPPPTQLTTAKMGHRRRQQPNKTSNYNKWHFQNLTELALTIIMNIMVNARIIN